MKKFLYWLFVLVITFITFSSCQNTRKNFNLTFEGDLLDSTSYVKGNFKFVVNSMNSINTENIVDTLSITKDQGKEIDDWVNKYVNNNFISKINLTSDYTFTVTGYVFEESTNMIFKINKVFTNDLKE